MSAPLAVTGWSAVSALGIGAGTFSDGIIAGRTAGQGAERDDTAPAPGLEGSVPGFDIRRLLGRKNTRAMDRITGLTVLTVGRLLDAEQAAGHEFSGHETGFVLGTTTGSVQSMMDFSRDSFIQDRPYLVDPARFPYAVMNCAARTQRSPAGRWPACPRCATRPGFAIPVMPAACSAEPWKNSPRSGCGWSSSAAKKAAAGGQARAARCFVSSHWMTEPRETGPLLATCWPRRSGSSPTPLPSRNCSR